MSDKEQEKRRHPRLLREEILSIKLIAPPTDFAHQGEAIYCSTRDLSASGMQININVEMPVGQEVDIWIVLLENKGTFHLNGKVSWIRHQDDDHEPGEWLAGLALEADSEDLAAWQALFAPEDPVRH